MDDICLQAKDFLSEILRDLRFDLSVSVEKNEQGCLLNLEGEDSGLLLNEGGEVLDAFETILFQAFGKGLDRTQRFICDADGFRQTRNAELQAMARYAAQSVHKSGKPFTFGKLNSTERRIIHLTLAEESNLVTESVGTGSERRLQIRIK